MAKVEKLQYGNDGLVRSADIRLAKGRTNRPIVKLYPLEVSAETTEQTGTPKAQICDAISNNSRPIRHAAKRAQERIKNWAGILRE